MMSIFVLSTRSIWLNFISEVLTRTINTDPSKYNLKIDSDRQTNTLTQLKMKDEVLKEIRNYPNDDHR